MEATAPPVSRLRSPDVGDFDRAWELFIRAVAAVAARRAEWGETGRLGLLAEEASRAALEQAAEGEARDAIREALADERLAVALSVLVEEMEYYAWRYRAAFPELLDEIEGGGELWGDAEGDPSSPEAVDDAEVVMGSIEKILDRLPGPLRKVLEALLQALRLTRGIV